LVTVIIRVLFILTIVSMTGVVVHLSTGSSQLIEEVNALPMHSFDLTLASEEGEGRPTESQADEVEFHGNVTVEKPEGVERVTISLSAECENGWETVISPQTMVFINPDSQRFLLVVVVPEGTHVMTVQFQVNGHASSLIWEEDQSIIGRVKVGQYFKMRIEAQSPLNEPEPGGSAMGKLMVTNDGNGVDTFQVTVVNPPKEVTDWSFSEDALTVPPGLYGEFSYTLYIIEDLDPGFDGLMLTVIFKVVSIGAKSNDIPYEKTYPVFIYYKGLESELREEWPTYVGYGVAIVILIALPVMLIRWKRRRRYLRES
jgi:hypothetical protein